MAEIQNPAAIFSAEGLKLFIEAIKGNDNKIAQAVTGPVMADVNFDNEVDSLVQEYREHTNVDEYEKITNIVSGFLIHQENFTAKATEINDHLRTWGYDYSPKRVWQIMNSVIRRDPRIKRLGNGFYELVPSEVKTDE
jgi:hypothetical protein